MNKDLHTEKHPYGTMMDSLNLYQEKLVKDVPPEPVKHSIWKEVIKWVNILGVVFTFWFLYRGISSGFLTDADRMQAFLEQMGIGAPIVFVFIQIVQVVIPIIPAAMTIPVGTLVFGFWYGYVLNFIGIMIGSVIIFYLARRFGRPFVQMVIDERHFNRYMGWMESERGFIRIFTYAMFFPFTPADFLCCFAGLTPISFKRFMIVLTLSKIPTLWIYQYGTTALLNFFIHR